MILHKEMLKKWKAPRNATLLSLEPKQIIDLAFKDLSRFSQEIERLGCQILDLQKQVDVLEAREFEKEFYHGDEEK